MSLPPPYPIGHDLQGPSKGVGVPRNPELQRTGLRPAPEFQYRWTDMDAAILNRGMELAMEFGKNWLQPIQDRLGRKHKALSRADLDEYEHVCREALDYGIEQVKVQMRAAARKEKEAARLFSELMTNRYPWITDKTLSHLFSQGCYYAWKDGEL